MDMVIDYNQLLVDKENEVVKYNDELHKYWVKESNLSCISVTTLIHKFTNFDEDFWSSYKALESLLGEDIFKDTVKNELLDSKQFNKTYLDRTGILEDAFSARKLEILQEWKEKREISCIRGTAIHKEMELGHLKGDTKELKLLNLGGTFNTDVSNKVKPGESFVYPELLLSRISDDGKLRVAGQADLIIIDGFDVYILDYKSNKKMETKSYFDRKLKKSQKLKYPLNNLDDCNFMHYSLQLSTYAWMLEKLDPRFNIKMLLLIHIDHDNKVTHYECEYLKTEVERMLSFYKKQIEHDEFKQSREKVIF